MSLLYLTELGTCLFVYVTVLTCVGDGSLRLDGPAIFNQDDSDEEGFDRESNLLQAADHTSRSRPPRHRASRA